MLVLKLYHHSSICFKLHILNTGLIQCIDQDHLLVKPISSASYCALPTYNTKTLITIETCVS